MKIHLLCAASLGALLTASGAHAQQQTPVAPAPSISPMPASQPTLNLNSGDTRALQNGLARAGFNPGPADGVYGMRTRQAVMAWQRQNNVEPNGNVSAPMLSSLGVQQGAAAMPRAARNDRDRAYMGGGMVQQPQGGGPVDAAGHPLSSNQAGGGEGPGSNNARQAPVNSRQGVNPTPGGRAIQRDAAGRPLGSNAAGGGEGPGSNNERASVGSRVPGTGGAPPRDAAGQPLSSNAPGGGEGPGSNNVRPGGQTTR